MNPDLTSLLFLPIPEANPNPKGFLEIAGIAHYENVNSRVYTHFLNIQEYPAIRFAFLDALLQLIEEKSDKVLSLQNFTALLEDVTNLQYRIDILIKDNQNKTAIIIENKIHHVLNNDLRNYWDHVPFPKENKVGILLTLNPHPTNDPRMIPEFINITHSEWINRIKENGLPFGIPSNYYQYINDFASTIDNLTKSYMMNEQAKFYFQHAPKIKQAKQTMDAASGFLNDQMNLLAGKLGWCAEGSAFDWKYIWDKENDLYTYFTIWYGPIVNHGELKFSIILELSRKDKDRMNLLEPILEDIAQYKNIEMRHMTRSDRHFVHFCVREYSITFNELERFGEYLYELILRDFSEIIVTIIKEFYPDLNISKWIHNFENHAN